MTQREATAKQKHRAGVFEAARNDSGLVRCFADPSEKTCRGRLQAAHWIAAQTLRIQQSQARLAIQREAILRGMTTTLNPVDGRYRLIAADLDDLIADPRNGAAMCEHHHQAFDHHRITLTPPPSVVEFAVEYGLEHLIDDSHTAASAA